MGLLADMQRASHERVAAAKARATEAELRARIADSPPPPPLVLANGGFDVIAELKLRSPSQGALAHQASDPVARLAGYAKGGAAAVSVLTEPTRFDGSLEHLRLAAETLAPQRVPVMRKDFLVDPYQLLEARERGASGALLILQMVERARLIEMLDCAAELGLFVLLEAFDAGDLEMAAEIAAERRGRSGQVLMGLNCRNLETLAIDPRRFGVLARQAPRGLALGRGKRCREPARCRGRGGARLSAGAGRNQPDEAQGCRPRDGATDRGRPARVQELPCLSSG